MSINHFGRYRQNELMTASPNELLIALYDGALRFATQARMAMLAGKFKEKGNAIVRVIAIVTELARTLDHKRAPTFCEHIEKLYGYMVEQLLIASSKCNVNILDNVIAHLSSLREAWYTAIKSSDKPQVSV
jgi:flagellar secretion chaperone FliS